MLFSIVAAPTYIPTNSVGGLPAAYFLTVRPQTRATRQ